MRLRIRFRPFLRWLKLDRFGCRSSSQERRVAEREKGGWSLERNEETRRRPGRVGPLWIFEGRDALPVEFRDSSMQTAWGSSHRERDASLFPGMVIYTMEGGGV